MVQTERDIISYKMKLNIIL